MVDDTEHAIRLVHPNYIVAELGGRPTGAAINRPLGTPVSLFVEELLPNGSPQVLIDRRPEMGRLRWTVQDIRNLQIRDLAVATVNAGFDVKLDPSGATGVFSDLTTAHAELTGPTDVSIAVEALVLLSVDQGGYTSP